MLVVLGMMVFFLSLHRFYLYPGFRLHLTFKYKFIEELEFRGKVDMSPLGCSRDYHYPQAVFNSLFNVAVTSEEVGKCRFPPTHITLSTFQTGDSSLK